ncbi:CIR protein PIR protein [Plasmodium vinckei petteri]|uniref:CIR protein PIR protein n=1 Tax=Plasmodium vinckei petteri TaxID=138298 RepID=A0A6V7TBC6_PLAVN|nr:CIR protein PIR protein [Plasmodium vinckei petteri]
MAKSDYSIEDLYSVFKKIDGYFYEEKQKGGGTVERFNNFISRYCPYSKSFDSGVCLDYIRMASSGVINLLDNLKKYNLEYDKLAEYAILFLSYKLKQHSQYKSTNLNTVYTKDIEINKYYNNNKIKDNGPTYKAIIDKKKDLMNMNINEISKFNEAFSILCKLYNEIKNNKLDCTKYSSYPENFANKFEELNEDSNINGNTSYSKLLSTLSDDYNHLKNNYGNNNSCNFPPLPKVKTPPSKLIPALSTVSVIPVFLGIAYKTIYKKKTKKSKEEIENEYMIRRTVIVPGTCQGYVYGTHKWVRVKYPVAFNFA